jgi:hypothetical protein
MMNTTSTSFQSVLDALLSDRKEFPRRYLQEFSDIGALELKNVLDIWPRVKPSRKLTLLEELDALAEADTLVSFDDFARALLTDPEAEVRTRAIRLLDEYEDPKIVPSYLDMLKNDPNVNVRTEVANALNLFVDLGELEEIPESIYHQVEDALLAAANSEDDVRVRRAALESRGFYTPPPLSTRVENPAPPPGPARQTSAHNAMPTARILPGRRAPSSRWAVLPMSAGVTRSRVR